MRPSPTLRTLALARITAVTDALPPAVRAQVVFIGGTVLPFLVNVETQFDAPRVTKDVDAVMLAVSYTRMGETEEALRSAQFRHAPNSPISRWIAPNGEIFDLTSAGEHSGGTGSQVDNAAIETAQPLPERPDIRVLSGVGFLLMKTAAFHDRGAKAPSASKDLADLAVLLVGRATLPNECQAAAEAHRMLVRDLCTRLLGTPRLAGVLRGHYVDRSPIPPETPDSLATLAMERLTQLADINPTT